jgi:hypothetical protein
MLFIILLLKLKCSEFATPYPNKIINNEKNIQYPRHTYIFLQFLFLLDCYCITMLI